MSTIERFSKFGETCIAPVSLGRSDTALIVIDVQYAYAARGRGTERMVPAEVAEYYLDRMEQTVVPSIARLIGAFRDRQMPVIYVCLGSDYQDLRDVSPTIRQFVRKLEERSGITDVFWSRNPDYKVLADLAPQPGDTVIQKRTWGSFSSSAFEEVLRARGIKSLVLVGCATSCCVESTARDAFDRGYGTVLVEECCGDLDQKAHDATMFAIHYYFGRVAATADDVVTAIDARQPL